MTTKQWMIYGAYGYSGELIAGEAKARGLKPVLAGRSESKLKAVANELGFDYRVFDLDDEDRIAKNLDGIDVVVHCAGPFSATSAPMVEGCIRSGTHYCDITGEISVFDHIHVHCADAAKEAGVVLCPGVGFDVIPTDCLAAKLKEALPDATHLALGFDSRSTFSPGTAKTSVEGLASGGRVRRKGKIVPTKLAAKTRKIDFGNGEKLAMTIPWGDVCTAYFSTGIPNIEVYIPGSPAMIKNTQRANWLRPILSLPPVQWLAKKRIEATVTGLTAEERKALKTAVWGEVRNDAGMTVTGRIETANGYTVTMHGAIEHALKLMNDPPASGGAYTPSMLFGADFVTTLPESGTFEITQE